MVNFLRVVKDIVEITMLVLELLVYTLLAFTFYQNHFLTYLVGLHDISVIYKFDETHDVDFPVFIALFTRKFNSSGTIYISIFVGNKLLK